MAEIDYLIHAPKDGDPYVHLSLSQSSVIVRDGRRYRVLSPQLIGDTEIDYYVDDLKKQLDRVRENAKRALDRAKNKAEK